MLWNIPWIVVALILYNVLALAFSVNPTVGASVSVFDQELLRTTLLSQTPWALTLGDLMISLTLVLLFVELMKASRHSTISAADHGLSMLLFIVCLVEFITVRQAATSVFFIILMVTLIDVMAGFVISIRFARRGLSLGTEAA
ncbi:MAG: hypothetical protein SGJ17_14525 [Hyphomicrobiales bacterium]|nr:hypothetical protein [Hyphomicrobiales bacterium]